MVNGCPIGISKDAYKDNTSGRFSDVSSSDSCMCSISNHPAGAQLAPDYQCSRWGDVEGLPKASVATGQDGEEAR